MTTLSEDVITISVTHAAKAIRVIKTHVVGITSITTLNIWAMNEWSICREETLEGGVIGGWDTTRCVYSPDPLGCDTLACLERYFRFTLI